MNYPVAMIPYTNMAPYRENGVPKECRFVFLNPLKSIQALKENKVLAAAVPVGGLPLLQNIIEPLGSFGIAAKERSMSVLFFTDREFSSFIFPAKVRITSHSASSVRLLYLLFGYNNGFSRMPCRVQAGEPFNGELIIGDAALQRARHLKMDLDSGNTQKSEMIIDLATEWYKKHKLPFVFARWVIRRDAPAKIRRSIENWLAEFKEYENQLVEKSALRAAEHLNMTVDYLKTYFNVIRRSLTSEDLAGQELFLAEFEKYQKEPVFNYCRKLGE